MIHPALVNLCPSFVDLGGTPSPGAADADVADPVASAAIQSERYDEATAGYPCCYNCGHREPCDQWCPHARAIEDRMIAEMRELTAGFEIEPVPEFIRRAVG